MSLFDVAIFIAYTEENLILMAGNSHTDLTYTPAIIAAQVTIINRLVINLIT